MLHVPLFIEILRLRPRLVFWLVTLTQAALWTAVPALVYSAPPGNVSELLAIGHELSFAPEAGPPLAYWLAEFAFNIAGQRLIGVYALAQLCVIVTYWAVFALARSIVGDRQAVLAVLLMIGISALSVPTPDFGPTVLAMPLWALSVLHLWRAVGEDRRAYWMLLVVDLGLLLLTSYLALVIIVLLVLFALANARIRARLRAPEPRAAALVLAFMALPTITLLVQIDVGLMPRLLHLRSVEAVFQNLIAWLRLGSAAVLSHAGLAILVGIAANVTWLRRTGAPAIERQPADKFAHDLIYFVALVVPVAITFAAAAFGYAKSLNPAALVVFSGLAVVLAAGDRILLHNQRLLGWAWGGLLLIPPIFVAVAVPLAPLILGVDLKVAQPASELGQFFSDSFERRTGRPLAIVGGDPHLSMLIAIGSQSRPDVLVEEPGFPNVVSPKNVAEKGAILVWPATDTGGTPPAEIKARYPDLAVEVPRTFERRIQGQLPLMRVGWAMIRPSAPPP